MSDRLTRCRRIARLVPEGSRVLDLGCGDGALLDHLQRERGCSGYGIEIADANVLACVKRGVNVIQLNLDEGLSMFDDDTFDVVLQIDTLQHLRNAETMLRETARVGKLGIVAFPNFAHWPNRLSIAARPHAGDQAPALPVVRHAQHPRRHLQGLRGAGHQEPADDPGCLRPAGRPRGARPAQPARPAPRSSSSSAAEAGPRAAAARAHLAVAGATRTASRISGVTTPGIGRGVLCRGALLRRATRARVARYLPPRMNILITGGAGFLGARLARTLLAAAALSLRGAPARAHRAA